MLLEIEVLGLGFHGLGPGSTMAVSGFCWVFESLGARGQLYIGRPAPKLRLQSQTLNT